MKKITFVTDHLLSKWGFYDGDLLGAFLRDSGFDALDEAGDAWDAFETAVLCEVVEIHVLPHIKTPIKPYRVFTSHNPIRVYEVNGIHVTDYEKPPQLAPDEVSVTEEAIVEIAHRLNQARLQLEDGILNPMQRSPQAQAIFDQNDWS